MIFEPWRKEFCIAQGKQQKYDAEMNNAQHKKNAHETNYGLSEEDHIRHIIGGMHFCMVRGVPDDVACGLLSLPWKPLPKNNKTVLAPYKACVPRVTSELVLKIPENLPKDTIVLLVQLGDLSLEWEPKILGYSTRNEAEARELGIWRGYGNGSHSLCLGLREINPFDESFPLYLPFDHLGFLK
jgi:hypothetical protein